MAAIGFYLFYLISLLFPHHAGTGQTPHAMSPPAAPHLTQAAASGPSPLDTVRSIIFWIIVLGIVVYSATVLWRKRGPWLSRVPFLGFLSAPLRWIKGLLRFARRVGEDVGHAVASAVPRFFRQVPEQTARSLRLVSFSRMSPRKKIEYFYLSVCERAGQIGHPRPPDMTPGEYLAMLRASVPTVDPELESLTDSFIETRYGPRETSNDQVRSARDRWQSLKIKLRRTRLLRTKRS